MNVVEAMPSGDVLAFKLGFGPIGPPLMCVHFFLVDDIVIDTGQHHMQRAVLGLLDGHPVSSILLTHHHEDHSGNAAAIAEAHRATVFGHEITAEKMRRRFPIKPYQRYVWGLSAPTDVAPLPPEIESAHCTLLPIHCPGHSRDHVAYLEPDRGWLFSGDLYLGERIKFFRTDEIFGDQITSLKTVLTHDFDALFCAHNPSPAGGKTKLRQKLQFLEDFHGRVQQLKTAGHSVPAVIREFDHKRDRLVKWITLGNASFANMVRSAYNSQNPK
jgi:glyoxylase-like metal-dependent hydrolase (beta-lactamase superfamily II)